MVRGSRGGGSGGSGQRMRMAEVTTISAINLLSFGGGTSEDVAAVDKLRLLSDLATQLSPDGSSQLPWASQEAAIILACNLTGPLSGAHARAIAIAALTERKVQVGLITLLATAIRNQATTAAFWAVPTKLCSLLLDHQTLVSPYMATLQPGVEMDVVRLLVKTDFLAAAAQSFARVADGAAAVLAASAAAPAPAPEGQDGSGSSRIGSSSSGAAAVAEVLDAYHPVWSTARLVLLLLMQAAQTAGAHVATDAGVGLHAAVTASRVLEHLSRMLLLLLEVMQQAGVAGVGEASGRPGASGSSNSSGSSGSVLLPPIYGLLRTVDWLEVRRVHAGTGLRRWMAEVVSGPCMQHFLAAHVVAQLAAADGGTSYGLRRGAGLPVMPLEGLLRPGPLEARGLLSIVDWWMWQNGYWDDPYGGPHAGRTIAPAVQLTLCLRLANAVEKQIVAGSAVTRLDPYVCPELAVRSLMCAFHLTAEQSHRNTEQLWGPAMRAVRRQLSLGLAKDDEMVPRLQFLLWPRLPLLNVGFPLPADPHPAVAAALAAGYLPAAEAFLRANFASLNTLTAVADVVEVLNDVFGFAGLEGPLAYGELWPAAALLATGGKLLSYAVEVGSPRPAVTASESLNDTMTRTRGMEKLKLCLDYSFFLRDMLKCLQYRADNKAWWQEDYGEAGPSFGGGLLRGNTGGICWWQRALGAGGSGASGGGAAGASGCRADTAGRGGSGASSSGRGGGAGPSAAATLRQPLRGHEQLATLATFALSRWLPPLARAAGRASETMDGPGGMHNPFVVEAHRSLCCRTYDWVPTLAHAYLLADPVREEEEAEHEGREHEGREHEGREHEGRQQGPGDEPAVPPAAADPSAAAAWRRLLLQDMELLGLVGREVRLMIKLTAAGQYDGAAELLGMMAPALLHLLVAFPAEVRAALTERIQLPAAAAAALGLGATAAASSATGPRRSAASRSSALPAVTATAAEVVAAVAKRANLIVLVAAAAHPISPGTTVQLLPELMARVCMHGEVTGCDHSALARGPDGDMLSTALALAGMLPPPNFAAAAVGLPAAGCSFPGCANLAGESEAGLGLLRCSGRCGGAAVYCSRPCQVAHWNAGHKVACGKVAAAAPTAEAETA